MYIHIYIANYCIYYNIYTLININYIEFINIFIKFS